MNNTKDKTITSLLEQLFPLCRSLTGAGVRETLHILGKEIPLVLHEIPSGTKVFDWTVPKEWNIRDAYIKNDKGERIVDFKKSNLHVMGYSTPIHENMSLEELRPHLYTLPEQPDLVPYRTSYYKQEWGFCMTHRSYEALPEGSYEVCIDSTLADGSLVYGELYIPGQSADEILLSTYVCHPSLANDNLSGPILLSQLGKYLRSRSGLRYSFRLLFLPETIGSLVWLSRNKPTLSAIKHGLVITCVGDPGPFTYKKTRDGNQAIDRAAIKVLAASGKPYSVVEFSPSGSDERQYSAPALNLPVGSLMRTPYGRYPQYHTSGDNLSLVTGAQIAETFALYQIVIETLEKERAHTYVNTHGFGEPQLDKRGLYASTGGVMHDEPAKQALMWVLNLSDGTYSLEDIAARAGIPFDTIAEAARLLHEQNLIRSL